MLIYLLAFVPLFPSAQGARQPYDVRKIIDAFRTPRDDLRIICAHRGLRWNGTAENSRDSYFRASEAGIECIETDIRVSKDGKLPMIHDHGLGRTTDIGEQTGLAAYNPYTGKGYNPRVKSLPFDGSIERLRLRDDQGRVRNEYVPSLPQMVQSIYDSGMNVVLQLDIKDRAAVEPSYWALKNLTNRAGVPANEWCIYKIPSKWHKTPEIFEAQPWVQDAFNSGIRLAYIPVYEPKWEKDLDQLDSMKKFSTKNYTISVEVELRSIGGPTQNILDYTKSYDSPINTVGIFHAVSDFTYPNTDTFFDTANYSLPADLHVNNSIYQFEEDWAPVLLDSKDGKYSTDGHDYRSDFNWIIESCYDWIITDTPDLWHKRLERQGLRNIKYMIADGKSVVEDAGMGWYHRSIRDVQIWASRVWPKRDACTIG